MRTRILIILMIGISLILATEIGFSKEEVGNVPIFCTQDGSLVLAVAIGDTEFNGEDWVEIPDPAGSQIGDTFTGSSGTTYILKEYEHEPGEKEYEEKFIGMITIGIWVILED